MRETPLVSVALCTYNGATHLRQQLESLWAQTWPRFEVVAVDDGSSDGTWELLQQAAQRHPTLLRIARNENNLGFSANFERAMSMCGGAYIAPCDQDDLWHPSKLERLATAIGSHTLAYCDSSLVDERGQPLGTRLSDRINMVEGSDPLAFAFWNCISGHAMLFRRDLLAFGPTTPSVRFHDWWIAFVAASQGSIVYVDEPLVGYRQHADSQTDALRLRRRSADSSEAKSLARLAWFDALARFPGAQQPLFETLHALASARQDQWLCPMWFSFLCAHADRLMAINKRESFARFGLKQFFGMRWRRRTLTADSGTFQSR